MSHVVRTDCAGLCVLCSHSSGVQGFPFLLFPTALGVMVCMFSSPNLMTLKKFTAAMARHVERTRNLRFLPHLN